MADKKASVTKRDDGSKVASFEVATTLGPVQVDIDATNRPDLSADEAEAEALIHAREIKGGVALSAKSVSSKAPDTDDSGKAPDSDVDKGK